ncbi:MAG: DUF445 family protein [Treponema sp.]|jgi:uncharacterized membrane-anchored protein YjiN (DUF445 family)|nr:DUF445 family protein [Treponema sp.]
MKEIILFCVPPLAGAAIGFVTNVLAIRMLFRPLRPCYFFRWRIPFTPGILPRERARLAESIGAMVERELLTPETLRERLRSPELRERFRQGLSGYSGRLPGLFEGTAEKLYPRVLEGLVGFLRKPETRDQLAVMGRDLVDKIVLDSLAPLQRLIVTSGQFDYSIKENMPAIIDSLIQRLEDAGNRDDVRKRIIAYAGDGLFDGGVLKAALKDLLDSEQGPQSPQDSRQAPPASPPAGPEGPETLESLITEKLFLAADSQIETFLGAIDVRAMVRNQINRLDMLRVEGIILDVMANQLKWIDVFGAILGFLIGLFQALFSWGMRLP